MMTRLDYRTKQFRRLACVSVPQLLSSDRQHLQDLIFRLQDQQAHPPFFKQSTHKCMHIKILPVLIDKLSKDWF